MKDLTKTEQIIYDNAGGGESGEIAVLSRREYLENYKREMSYYRREKTRNRYSAVKEKETVTMPILIEEDL